MAVPNYTEDLTDIATGDESSGWTNFDTNDQGLPQYSDADYPYIQGSYAVTQTCSKSKTLANMGYDYGSTISLPTDGAFLVWQAFSSPFALDDYAGTTTGQAGMCVLIGDDESNFDYWEVGGKDKSPMPYGGWQCHAVNTTVSSDGNGAGTKTIDRQVGAQVALTAYPSKGEPHQIDIMRFGRCSAIFEGGEAANYATIAGFVAQNDNHSNRWGLLQKVPGGYLWQGRWSLGTVANAVDLRDSNVTIFVKWTPKVTANFNTIEVINSGSNIELTGFKFVCLDPAGTASKGRWITTDDAPVVLISCSWEDWSTFDFDSNTIMLSCTWLRCDQIDPQQADLSFSNVLESSATGGGADGGAALLWDVAADPNTYLNDMTFSKGAGSHHAIEFGTSAPQTINLTNMTFTGFSASNQQTTSVVYLQDTGSDVTWTINHSGTTGTISYYKERSGDTVNVVSSYNHVLIGLELNTEVTYVTAGTSTELFHTENATVSDGDGKYQTTYPHPGGATVDILIHHVNYKPDISNIYSLTLPSDNAIVKVTMFDDENYYNPT